MLPQFCAVHMKLHHNSAIVRVGLNTAILYAN